jgi:hypothetical protein
LKTEFTNKMSILTSTLKAKNKFLSVTKKNQIDGDTSLRSSLKKSPSSRNSSRFLSSKEMNTLPGWWKAFSYKLCYRHRLTKSEQMEFELKLKQKKEASKLSPLLASLTFRSFLAFGLIFAVQLTIFLYGIYSPAHISLRNTAPKIQAAGIRNSEARHINVLAKELVYGDEQSGSMSFLTQRLRDHSDLFMKAHLALRYGDADWQVVVGPGDNPAANALSENYDPTIWARNDTAISMGLPVNIQKLGLDTLVFAYHNAILQLLSKFEPFFGYKTSTSKSVFGFGTNSTSFENSNIVIGINREQVLEDPIVGFIETMNQELLGPMTAKALVSNRRSHFSPMCSLFHSHDHSSFLI